ncbi:MAG: zinc ribbon domain-containing protein [Ktedonobacteraceae bacterium]
MQCSYCGTPLPAGTPFCPNCGRPTAPTNPANPTPYNAPQWGAPNTSNEAVPYMHFGSPQETSWVSPDVAPPSSPVQPYQPQQPLPNQQPQMIFGAGSPQEYPQPGVPPQQQPYQTGPQYQQYPQPSSPTTFGSGQGYPQAGPSPQPGMFVPGQVYGSPVPPLQQQSGTFGQERPYPAMNMPQQQGMYPQGYFAQPASVSQQRQRRSGLSKGIIALLIVLVIAIVGGGSILLYATVLLPSSRHAQTNTISTQSKTPIVQATTAITTTNPQDLYIQVMSRKPTLNDPLTAQDANNWQDFSTLQGCTFSGSALHLHGSAGSCIGESTSFSNFAYQVKVNIIQGNVGGIAFRFDAINRKFYFFAINPDGVYAIVYVGGGSSSANNEKLLASATSTAITTGLNQLNTLMVIARGSNINIYINKQYVTTLTDGSSTNGAIGMLGGNSASNTSDVAFSDAQVWAL